MDVVRNSLLVCDMGNHRIQEFSLADRTKVLQVYGKGQGNEAGYLNYPCSILSFPTKDMIVTCESIGNRLQFFSRAGESLAIYGARGEADGQLREPSSIDVNLEKGLILVCDKKNNRVQSLEIR